MTPSRSRTSPAASCPTARAPTTSFEKRPRRRRRKESRMTDESRTTGQMSKQELEAERGRELTDREAMSLVNANVAIPINAAVAANVLSDDAVAYAQATQDAAIDQSN